MNCYNECPRQNHFTCPQVTMYYIKSTVVIVSYFMDLNKLLDQVHFRRMLRALPEARNVNKSQLLRLTPSEHSLEWQLEDPNSPNTNRNYNLVFCVDQSKKSIPQHDKARQNCQ